MKPTVIYIRVSTIKQVENGLSIDNQLKQLRDYKIVLDLVETNYIFLLST